MKGLVAAALFLALSIAPAWAPARVLATSNFSLYLAPSSASPAGSDSNDCLSTSTPCQTLQHAVTTLRAAFDLGCKAVSIVMAPGSYAGATISGAQVGQCSQDDFLIVGNMGSPTSVTISSTIALRGGAYVVVKGVKITTSAGSGFSADDSSRLDVGYVDFGATAGAQLTAGPHARAKVVNHSTVSGGAVQFANASRGQVQVMPGVIIVFTTSETSRVSYSQFFLAIESGLVNASYGSTQFWNAIGYSCSAVTQCAVGARIGLASFGLIYTGANGSQAWLPGSVDGPVPSDTLYN